MYYITTNEKKQTKVFYFGRVANNQRDIIVSIEKRFVLKIQDGRFSVRANYFIMLTFNLLSSERWQKD